MDFTSRPFYSSPALLPLEEETLQVSSAHCSLRPRGCCREWHGHRHQIGASEQSLGTGIHSAPTLPASGISERRPASPGHVTSARQLKFMPLSVVTLFPPSPQSAGIWVLGEMKTKSHSQKRKIFYLFCKGFAHRNQKGMKSCRIIWKRRTRQWHLSHCVIHAMIH